MTPAEVAPPPPGEPERAALARRGVRLNIATLVYNSLEASVAIAAGLVAGSVALMGFGLDSMIELAASLTALWRLSADLDPARRERAERVALRIISALFLMLAVYVAVDASTALRHRDVPSKNVVGIALAASSVVVMPLLARAKRRVASRMNSGALAAEAQQTSLCGYLSAILLGGLLLNATVGWWWADPVAALVMVPIIAHEGVQGVRRQLGRNDGCC